MTETIHIETMSYGTAAIGHANDGKTVFIAGGVPGDTVEVEILEEKPRFRRGRVSRVLEASNHRVKAVCAHANQCGGCPWMHIAYSAQIEAKRSNVVGSLVHGAGFQIDHAESVVDVPIASKHETHYRNKIEMNAGNSSEGVFDLGFKTSDDGLITPRTCFIAQKKVSGAPHALKGALAYAQGTQNLGIFRVGIRMSVRTGDCEIALWTTPGPFPRAAVAKILASALPATSIVRVMADSGRARKVKGVEVLLGKGFWEEDLAGFRFKTSAPSFFQVNTLQAEELIKEVVKGLMLDDTSLVTDLYAGGGTFSLPLAQRAHTVYAVEAASSSVRDLRRNADSNGVDIDVIGGDSAREITALGHLDALVVDPPRTGLAKGVAEDIARAKPRRLAYVSCNPSTWARDVTRLADAGFALERAVPVDLFPQTYHTEVVSLFSNIKKDRG